MGEALTGLTRSHYCGEVGVGQIGETVTVMGWAQRRRDLGQLIFIALRDRTGIVQATVDGNSAPAELFHKAESVRGEFVLAVRGRVAARTPENHRENCHCHRFRRMAHCLFQKDPCRPRHSK